MNTLFERSGSDRSPTLSAKDFRPAALPLRGLICASSARIECSGNGLLRYVIMTASSSSSSFQNRNIYISIWHSLLHTDLGSRIFSTDYPALQHLSVSFFPCPSRRAPGRKTSIMRVSVTKLGLRFVTCISYQAILEPERVLDSPEPSLFTLFLVVIFISVANNIWKSGPGRHACTLGFSALVAFCRLPLLFRLC